MDSTYSNPVGLNSPGLNSLDSEPVDSPSFDSPTTPEKPAVPIPPSMQLRKGNGGAEKSEPAQSTPSAAPLLKGTVEPVDSDTGYYAPKQRNAPRSSGVVPYVAEAAPNQIQENSVLGSDGLDTLSDETVDLGSANRAESEIVEPAPIETRVESSDIAKLQNPTEQNGSEFDWAPSAPIPPIATESIPKVDVPTAGLSSADEPSSSTKRIRAIPISSKKYNVQPEATQPVILDEVRPVPFNVTPKLPVEPFEYQREMLPAKSEFQISPIVLKAFPVPNHIHNDRRVADARGVDAYGLPNADRVEFRPLPSLGSEPVDETPVYFSTDEAPFEMPPVDQRIPEPDSHSNQINSTEIQNLLDAQSEDTFTTATSYQVPMDNEIDAATGKSGPNVGSDKSPAGINAPIGVQPIGVQPVETRTTAGNSLLRIVPPLESNGDVYYQPTDVDRVFGLGAFNVNSNPSKSDVVLDQSQRIRILRMRAITPLDPQAVVPPRVNFKSMVNPVFVRRVHPEAHSFVKDGLRLPRDQQRPVFDTERLEASIRGVLPEESGTQNQQRTIDR